MGRQTFKATKGLLEDDMRKQAGSIAKSWLEAVMNSIDAGASQIDLEISKEEAVIVDDGEGIKTEDDITKFERFGEKGEDMESKAFSRFRRGRGQIFNFGINIWHSYDNILVVNLNNDETTIDVSQYPIDMEQSDSGVISSGDSQITLNTSDLSFNFQKASETFEGTKITVKHFKSINDLDSKLDNFRSLVRYMSWFHDVTITLNGDEIDKELRPDVETEHAFFSISPGSWYNNIDIYNKGAFVRSVKSSDGSVNDVPAEGIIVTKNHLDLNNARNDIIDGDKEWATVRAEFIEAVEDVFVETNDLNIGQSKWLIERAAKDESLLIRIGDKTLLEDITGTDYTLNEISGEKVTFAPRESSAAKELQERRGVIVLKESFENAVGMLQGHANVKEYSDMIDSEMAYEMKPVSEDGLSKRRADNLEKVRAILQAIKCYDDVKPGHSKHKSVWRDGSGTIFVDKNFINTNKDEFYTTVIDRVVEVASMDGDTRKEENKNRTFKSNYYRYMSRLSEVRLDLAKGSFDSDSIRGYQ